LKPPGDPIGAMLSASAEGCEYLRPGRQLAPPTISLNPSDPGRGEVVVKKRGGCEWKDERRNMRGE